MYLPVISELIDWIVGMFLDPQEAKADLMKNIFLGLAVLVIVYLIFFR